MSRSFLVPVLLPADPTAALEAATKQYVDNAVGFTFMQDTVPTATSPGQTWFNTATGASYAWINDGTSTQWVQFAPGGGGGSGKARGVVAYSQITAAQGGIGGSGVNIAGLSVTWIADPTRTYKTTVFGTASSTVVNDDLNAYIVDGAGAVQLQMYLDPYLDNSTSTTFSFSVVETGLSGSITRKVQAKRAGTGTVTWYAAANTPSFIMVEDITYEVGGGVSGTQHAARVYLAGVKSVANNSQYIPVWDNDNFDVGDLWNPAVPGRFTVPVGGIYLVGYTVAWAPNATGGRSMFLRKNGDGLHRAAQVNAPGSTQDPIYGNSIIMQMQAGDYVECVVLQNSGAALNMTGDNANKEGASSFWIARVGA